LDKIQGRHLRHKVHSIVTCKSDFYEILETWLLYSKHFDKEWVQTLEEALWIDRWYRGILCILYSSEMQKKATGAALDISFNEFLLIMLTFRESWNVF